jgi:hypothetical protein
VHVRRIGLAVREHFTHQPVAHVASHDMDFPRLDVGPRGANASPPE